MFHVPARGARPWGSLGPAAGLWEQVCVLARGFRGAHSPPVGGISPSRGHSSSFQSGEQNRPILFKTLSLHSLFKQILSAGEEFMRKLHRIQMQTLQENGWFVFLEYAVALKTFVLIALSLSWGDLSRLGPAVLEKPLFSAHSSDPRLPDLLGKGHASRCFPAPAAAPRAGSPGRPGTAGPALDKPGCSWLSGPCSDAVGQADGGTEVLRVCPGSWARLVRQVVGFPACASVHLSGRWRVLPCSGFAL